MTTAPRHALPTAGGRHIRAATDWSAPTAPIREGSLALVHDRLAEYRSDMRELPMCRGGAVDA
ncbi:hypothetical protein AB0K11_13705 [Mycobacterium sp. NPDC050551]|uniref:hypothetical protein n=1 Tax=Mycobacterium sp. NPDC050551 TaxID=3155407 RepID=UPI003442C31E